VRPAAIAWGPDAFTANAGNGSPRLLEYAVEIAFGFLACHFDHTVKIAFHAAVRHTADVGESELCVTGLVFEFALPASSLTMDFPAWSSHLV